MTPPHSILDQVRAHRYRCSGCYCVLLRVVETEVQDFIKCKLITEAIG